MLRSNEPVDISHCDREPIHVPGSIQPHGLLFVLHGDELRVIQVSENVQSHLGLPLEAVLDQPIERILCANATRRLREVLGREIQGLQAFGGVEAIVGTARPRYEAVVHRSQRLIVLELEPAVDDGARAELKLLLNAAMTQLREARTVRHLCELAAQHAAQITGFHRAMIYQFDPYWNGEVLAEYLARPDDSYLGLRYPASDIPAQARRLYRKNPLRLIMDVGYRPAALVPAENPVTRQPLDMSFSVLRSVSPIHVEYLKNMRVGSSMSVSLLVRGRLWGLIACHHRSPHYVPYAQRALCQLLGDLVSMQIELHEAAAEATGQACCRIVQASLTEAMSHAKEMFAALLNSEPNLLDFLPAGGVAVVCGSDVQLRGITPSSNEILELARWLGGQAEALYHTDRLSEAYGPAQAYRDRASGLLAIRLAGSPAPYLLWFRPELIHTVRWAGNPQKPADRPAGETLSPRRSFEEWKETVRGTSERWHTRQVRAAAELRATLVEVIAHRESELAELRALQRSNEALDSFTTMVSHDVREPLAGIQLYLKLLAPEVEAKLDKTQHKYLSHALEFAVEANEMIRRLHNFSRLANVHLAFEPTDLEAALQRVLHLLQPRITQAGTQIRVPSQLPTVVCDQARIGDVFSNLITNAVKYNDKPEKWIEIGYFTTSESQNNDEARDVPCTFYVKDNGVGVGPEHIPRIFDVFYRQHEHKTLAEGSGMGLAIVKAIIERHRGRIWVDSVPGEGTTFYFTLAAD